MRYTAGYTKWDYRRNHDVLKELHVEPVIKYIQDYQNKWMNHLRRMSTDRFPKAIVSYCPTGTISLDHPRKLLLLGFTRLFNILGHHRRFPTEREKYDKFCSKALISAWGSFMCRKSTTGDLRLYFPSEGSHTQDFYALKKFIDPGGIEPANLGSRSEFDNHWTSGVYSKKAMDTKFVSEIVTGC